MPRLVTTPDKSGLKAPFTGRRDEPGGFRAIQAKVMTIFHYRRAAKDKDNSDETTT
jgi:hypothetical protein